MGYCGIGQIRPLEDRPYQATWDAVEVLDFPSTFRRVSDQAYGAI